MKDLIALSLGSGGASSAADIAHISTAKWADGTNALAATNVAGAIEEIVSDLGAQAGATRVGFTPITGIPATNTQAAIGQVKGLVDGKADSDHSHTIEVADVGGLSAALAGKAPLIHSHTVNIADVTDLQASLDGKAQVVHSHDGAYARVDATNTFQGNQVVQGILLVNDMQLNTSDARLKTEVAEFKAPFRLRPVRVTWNEDGRPDVTFLAQEVQKSYPEFVGEVHYTENDEAKIKLGIAYGKITVILAAQVNQLFDENQDMRKEISQLRSMLESLALYGKLPVGV